MSIASDIGAKRAAEDIKIYVQIKLKETGEKPQSVESVLMDIINKCDDIYKAADTGYY